MRNISPSDIMDLHHLEYIVEMVRQNNIFEMIIKTEIMIQLLRVSCEIISKLKNG